jgi:hypothetical protein
VQLLARPADLGQDVGEARFAVGVLELASGLIAVRLASIEALPPRSPPPGARLVVVVVVAPAAGAPRPVVVVSFVVAIAVADPGQALLQLAAVEPEAAAARAAFDRDAVAVHLVERIAAPAEPA